MTALQRTFESIAVATADGVMTITLSRPEQLNAVDERMHEELTEALHVAAGSREVRVVVLASTGRCFSAGGSFELMLEANRDGTARRKTIEHGRALFSALSQAPKPIVVGMQGDAIGLGATVALACDVVVAARQARIGDPHVSIGLVAGDGGCVVWPLAAGMIRARRHLLTGDLLSASDAYDFGLVTDLVDAPDDVQPVANDIARRIAALPPLAVQGTKQVLNNAVRLRSAEIADLAFSLEAETLASADMVEAIDAFTERRPGNYRGH